MTYPILTTRVEESSLVFLRGRSRQVAEHFGLDRVQTTRFVTAVSEIARNAVQYGGGGSIAFGFLLDTPPGSPQRISAVVTDQGPGIAQLDGIFDGRINANGQPAVGLVGSKRLVDRLEIESERGEGTRVTIEMCLPRVAPRLAKADLLARMEEFARQKPRSPLEELERQNRELLETLQELRMRQIDLERADARKNQFLATLAHELRNPLGTLQMILQLIQRDPDMSVLDLTRRRDAMARQADQMKRLIEDLIDASRISQGKVELAKCSLELNQLVEEALEMTGSAIETKKHMVGMTRHQQELWLQGDPTRLKQAVGNLIHNAVRYTPAGGSIGITITREESHACITVQDTGIGIGADMLPHVFDLFVQGSGHGATPAGLGVGLTLVRKLVEGHGGRVQAASEGEGKGSRFVITLPLQELR